MTSAGTEISLHILILFPTLTTSATTSRRALTKALLLPARVAASLHTNSIHPSSLLSRGEEKAGSSSPFHVTARGKVGPRSFLPGKGRMAHGSGRLSVKRERELANGRVALFKWVAGDIEGGYALLECR
ncbi:hypothetical protein QBC34DRAFT_135858 [Podospora aff. communis PSN243]|uniref:3'-phosphate/5'-hydroxy nucleic acid ligase n=1 Tax=Podospora aff. communis PSN243 TaxID=3040156 RepID=A0AAV9H3N6_9PEZI|nr:hypothetical protein QBC34DRAFT_135858 [Podospora aff. communis PSN243]